MRSAYPDPVTGKNEWGIVKSPDGGVMGVYSLSEAKPFKIANFRLQDRDFEKAAKYADWKFVFVPNRPSSADAAGRQASSRYAHTGTHSNHARYCPLQGPSNHARYAHGPAPAR